MPFLPLEDCKSKQKAAFLYFKLPKPTVKYVTVPPKSKKISQKLTHRKIIAYFQNVGCLQHIQKNIPSLSREELISINLFKIKNNQKNYKNPRIAKNILLAKSIGSLKIENKLKKFKDN